MTNKGHKQLRDSLQFQLSLLRLAVIPHGNRRTSEGAAAAVELSRLAETLQARRQSSGSSQQTSAHNG